MIRLVLLIGILYLAFRLRKAWRSFQADARRAMEGNAPLKVDDVMVKDPVCNVYFPQRDGIRARVDGEEIYFCSEACRDKYFENKQ